jgi:hypothetical protein
MSKSLVLHVGLPKTATTSLQFWAHANRAELSARGIDYPDASGEAFAPKHQFIVNELMAGRLERTRRTVAESAAPSLFLSTEGLTNHLYDYSEDALAEFRGIVAGRQLTLFVVLREPTAWVRSYYKQAILNPTMERYHYGTALTLPEFSRLERVRRLTDHDSVLRDAARAYGAAQVVPARFEGDWFAGLLDVLAIRDPGSFQAMERRHESLSDDLIELFRQVNAMGVGAGLRQQFFGLMQRAVPSTHSILIRAGRESLVQPDVAGLQQVLAALQAGNGASAARLAALAQAQETLRAMASVPQ